MLTGRPVFPGTSTMNQIERVIQVTNMPSKLDIDAVASPFAATMLETLPVMNYKTIPETFPTASPDGLDVLHACFHFNPDKRPSAQELLKHVFVAEFHNEEEEPNFPGGTYVVCGSVYRNKVIHITMNPSSFSQHPIYYLLR